mmetsp:Transcript_10741/g.14920  ORF Transcript_10741/g.14920 Transcript_10741/m.14920 type:complete len:85 (-) Transcript_10741:121-375(-)
MPSGNRNSLDRLSMIEKKKMGQTHAPTANNSSCQCLRSVDDRLPGLCNHAEAIVGQALSEPSQSRVHDACIRGFFSTGGGKKLR